MKQNDARIMSRVIRPVGTTENGFFLDLVPSNGPPLIYCTRVGTAADRDLRPQRRPSDADDFRRLRYATGLATMNELGKPRPVKIVYRDPQTQEAVQATGSLDIAELVGRLGGLSGEGLHFNYGDIVAILQSLADPKSQKMAVAFKLQDPKLNFLTDQLDGATDRRPRCRPPARRCRRHEKAANRGRSAISCGPPVASP